MVAGIIPALIFPYLFPDTLGLYYFPLILVISVAGCIAGTLLTKPVDNETLKNFYKNVKPWGFWKPIRNQVKKESPDFQENKNFRRDMVNIFLGTIAQTAIVAAPLFLILREWKYSIIAGIIVLVFASIMKKTWWDKLDEFDQ